MLKSKVHQRLNYTNTNLIQEVREKSYNDLFRSEEYDFLMSVLYLRTQIVDYYHFIKLNTRGIELQNVNKFLVSDVCFWSLNAANDN